MCVVVVSSQAPYEAPFLRFRTGKLKTSSCEESMQLESCQRTQQDFEWFGPPERNTLVPLFLY
jgi:hypothetical protein